MAEARDYAAGAAGLGVGGLLGGHLADSDTANSLLVRYLTNKTPASGRPDFRVPVYAGADYNLEHGSGEAVMGSRISSMLNRHGIGSYYVNSQGVPTNTGWDGWRSPAVNNSIRLWTDDARISGRNLGNLRRMVVNMGSGDRRAFSLLMSAMVNDGVSPRNALQALRSGMFDGFTAGELLDAFRVSGKGGVADIVAGRAHVAPYASFKDKIVSGRLPHFLTGEAGMDYTTLPTADWEARRRAAKSVAENSYPFANAPRTRNLTLDTQFQANYRGAGDPLIPGSGMYDPGFGRRSRWARMWKYYHGGEREAYHAAIARIAEKAGIDPKTLTPGTKYMLISTGSAGANAAEKLRLAEKAFIDDPNVRILLQYGYGKKTPGPASAGLDLYTNNGVKEEIARINRARPGFVIDFAGDPDYKLLARNVDLHGTYGGSSTITEALANTNPTVTMSDTYLNRGNNNYGTARRGIQQIDSAATAIGRELRKGTGLGKVVNSRDGSQTLGQAIEGFGLSGADYGKIERDAVQKLRDAMYNSPGKFDPKAVDAANAMLEEQAARNKTFVDTVRRMVTNAIDRRDASAYRRMRPGVGKSLAGLSRALFRTPAGRRIGLPLALASALGLGGGAFAASRAAHSGGK